MQSVFEINVKSFWF